MVGKRKIIFIINSIASLKKRKRLEKTIDSFFPSESYTIVKLYTTKAGHASELAAKAVKDKPLFIVAAGGDGTINEVAGRMINTEIPLGVIPMGSGNGLARHFKIPFNIKKALNLLLTGSASAMDVGYLNGRPFFCTSGTGLDAEIAHYYKEYSRRGFMAYALSFVRVFFSYKSKEYNLEIDGKLYDFKALFISVANISQFGYNFRIAPNASASDGAFDIVVIKDFPKWRILPIALQSFFGAIENSRFVWHLQAKSLKIIYPLQDKFIHIDGDAEIQTGELEYLNKRDELKVIVKN
ncbi:MAG: diacylglycerol kinase family lipid kinase [Bacteroidales bacterium]|nr:diacylglycerol kinase family lipid kinase [Bacteroidales bacterium]MCF8391867.1 diacylglycerol kinase family lipid kinase [Bacteroidales bacterium]